MDKEYGAVPPKMLIEALRASGKNRYRRRAILTKGNGRWELVCCTVEGFRPGDGMPGPVPSCRYPKAFLFEDYLTGGECLEFVGALQDGTVRFGEFELKRSTQNPQWTAELVPVSNEYMAEAGCVVCMGFTNHGTRAAVRTLLAADQPYYPDVDEAARDWLPFPVYHSYSDSRNDHVIFILPESRAFIADATFSEKGTLAIVVTGTHLESLPLLIKGAYWEGKAIFHFDAPVINGSAEVTAAPDADSLEYYLIDRRGTVYDFHREDRFSQLQKGRRTLGAVNRTLADQVRKACHAGEGMHVEFKPFIDPNEKFNANKQKTKLLEIIIAAVAFANTEGGYIYLGVEDDCSISGIDEQLRVWTKGPLDEANITRYLGALKNRIKESIYGEVTLRLSHTELDGALVVAIEVPQASQMPVAVNQDRHLYVRAGASCQKAPPELWRSILSQGTRGF
jgi:hypothetical protein